MKCENNSKLVKSTSSTIKKIQQSSHTFLLSSFLDAVCIQICYPSPQSWNKYMKQTYNCTCVCTCNYIVGTHWKSYHNAIKIANSIQGCGCLISSSLYLLHQVYCSNVSFYIVYNKCIQRKKHPYICFVMTMY